MRVSLKGLKMSSVAEYQWLLNNLDLLCSNIGSMELHAMLSIGVIIDVQI